MIQHKAGKIDSDYSGKIMFQQGQTLILVAEIGTGAYASVWMCYSINDKNLYAIKIFQKKEKIAAHKEIELYNNFRELGIKNTVNHYTTFDDNGRICVVFDLMAGSLYDIIKKGGTDNDTVFVNGFDVDFVIKALYQVLQSLVDLHNNNITHGDIKPENILLYGRTKLHSDLIDILHPKSSLKRISDAIIKFSKNFGKNDCESNHESSIDSDDTCNSHNSSVVSEMSEAPKQIVLSDTEDVEYNDINDIEDVDDIDIDNIEDVNDIGFEFEENLNNNHVAEHLKLPRHYFDSPIVKLSDMGACVNINDIKKPIGVQTKYYKSPEIILGLEYGPPCDMWALGCTIYELLTGNILFDPDKYDNDKKRCMLHQIYAHIGKIPKKMADESPYKQVFFTDEYTLKENDIYGDNCDFYRDNIWMSFLVNLKSETITKYMLLNLILDMLKTDPKKRITAKDALEHPLFSLCH
nr:serine/threonine-protein kinase AFC2-like [Hydra vulgaris]